jgi:ABC-type antimicrobial peptide transport system permease subunit
MIGDADEKTYEFGMLRALGFGKRWLIAFLTIQALIDSISGIIIGLVSSYILNSLVCVIIFSVTEMKTSYQLSDISIYVATMVGLLVPLISNVFPI